MNFAPYQDDSPETTRALSPPPNSSTPTPNEQRAKNNPSPSYWGQPRSESLPSPEDFESTVESGPQQPQQQQQQQRGFGNGIGADARNVDVFGTSLPMRLDYEACMAYLLLPPAGPAVLLMFEHESDYVRFHAWQSALVFTFLFLLHLIFSFSSVISYLMLACDLTLIAWLTLRAYKDADTLDRCELPFFGRLASSFVDDE